MMYMQKKKSTFFGNCKCVFYVEGAYASRIAELNFRSPRVSLRDDLGHVTNNDEYSV
jgi:hypothetical protein